MTYDSLNEVCKKICRIAYKHLKLFRIWIAKPKEMT